MVDGTKNQPLSSRFPAVCQRAVLLSGPERVVRVRAICGLAQPLDNGGKVYILDRKPIDRYSVVAAGTSFSISVKNGWVT